MAENIKTIQLRLNTVNQVSKITKAMNLVSMSKLQKFQRKIKEFGDIANEFVHVKTEPFERAEELPKLVILFASDLGLASLYNRTLETAVKNATPEKVYWIGRQGFDRVEKNPDLDLLNEKQSSDRVELEDLYDEVISLMEDYQIQIAVPHMNGNTVEIHWRGLNKQLLNSDLIIYEPDYDTANKRFKEFYLYLTLYESYYYSKFSENMTRRIAMEEASNNASDMKEELRNRYNQLRQEEITQEILELSAGVE